MLIVMSGVSGSGKNTVIEKLMSLCDDFKIFQSATTRKPRANEEEKGVYIFLTKEQFENKIKEGEFFEFEKVHENFYGILKSELDLVRKNTQYNYIRDIDVNGNLKLRKYFSKEEILSIFLDAPDEILKKRLKTRGESEESLNLRLSRAEFERSHKKEYDLIIENINLDKTIKTILEEIKKRKFGWANSTSCDIELNISPMSFFYNNL